MGKINIEISVGELLDKISILKIKLKKINDPEKQSLLKKEYDILIKKMIKYKIDKNQIVSKLFQNLLGINEILWDIEDKIRVKEKNKSFDSEFIELARSVYFTNDKRSDIKKEINTLTNSQIEEVKEYEKY